MKIRHISLILALCFKECYPKWDCNRPWPELELFLPVATGPGPRKTEWRDMFLRTFLLFWPVQVSKTRLLMVIDEEHRNTSNANAIEETLAAIPKVNDSYRIVYNDPPRDIYGGLGSMRQQYLMFYADNFTNSDYVGFVDTDSFFLTYVDREDLFEKYEQHNSSSSGNGHKQHQHHHRGVEMRPVVNGKSGNPNKKYNRDPLWHSITKTTFDILNVTEPMKCMAYFPVIVKTEHMKALRLYLEQRYQLPFYEVFRRFILTRAFSQFNLFCAYLWHFHHADYAWYAHDLSPEWDYSNPTEGQEAQAASYPPQTRIPKPRIATHGRYHSPHPLQTGLGDPGTVDVLQAGYCFSPPFPKPVIYPACSFLSLSEDSHHLEVFEEMHRFEWSDFTTIQKPALLKEMAYQRYERIKDCAYAFEDTLYENITALMLQPTVHLKDGELIYTYETGKRMFRYNGTASCNCLQPFPNYDTFLALGYGGKKATMLTHRQFKNLPMGAEIPAVKG